jgi:hypothetical protein
VHGPRRRCANLSAGSQPEYLSHRNAKSSVLLPVQPGCGAAVGPHGAVRVDYVGTRGVHEPYQVQLNGYQNICQGCFAPYAYQQPLDQRFGSVNEFRTDANSAYAGLQTSLTEQFSGLTLRANYTFSHCLDEVSNGGLLPFSSQGILSPLPGELATLGPDSRNQQALAIGGITTGTGRTRPVVHLPFFHIFISKRTGRQTYPIIPSK